MAPLRTSAVALKPPRHQLCRSAFWRRFGVMTVTQLLAPGRSRPWHGAARVQQEHCSCCRSSAPTAQSARAERARRARRAQSARAQSAQSSSYSGCSYSGAVLLSVIGAKSERVTQLRVVPAIRLARPRRFASYVQNLEIRLPSTALHCPHFGLATQSDVAAAGGRLWRPGRGFAAAFGPFSRGERAPLAPTPVEGTPQVLHVGFACQVASCTRTAGQRPAVQAGSGHAPSRSRRACRQTSRQRVFGFAFWVHCGSVGRTTRKSC